MAEAPTEVVNAEDPASQEAGDPAAQFRGVGVNFKAKLIGIDDVGDSRGDKMCQESILKLKAAVKVAGTHKQKILVNISLEGLKILDLMTGEVQHAHPVNKISFVARDLTDRRAFGYIFSAEDGKHKLFGIKTAKVAETLVLSLRDLFQVVYDLRKQELEGGAPPQQQQMQQQHPVAAAAIPAAAGTQGNILGGFQPSGAAGEAKLDEMLQTMTSMDQFDPTSMVGDVGGQLPVTPGTPATPDLIGSEGFGAPSNTGSHSLSDELQSLSMPAEQPPPVPGASMTNDQILNQFRGAPATGMFGNMQQQQPAYQQQQQQAAFQQQQQFNPMQGGMQQQQAPQSNPFGGNAFAPQQPQMFQPQPQQLPQVPPRTGQMFQQPPQQQQQMFGGAPALSPLTPQSRPQQDQQQQQQAAKPDPFGDILGGMGAGAAPSNPKDMFKGFEMAKPTTAAATSGIDNYLLNSKGVLPVEQRGGAPTAMPRNTTDQNQSLFG